MSDNDYVAAMTVPEIEALIGRLLNSLELWYDAKFSDESRKKIMDMCRKDIGLHVIGAPIEGRENAAPHEMTAREYRQTYDRMCHGVYDAGCTVCPLYTQEGCLHIKSGAGDKAVAVVEQWAEEHPEKPEKRHKTYAEDFFEKFPKAEPKYYAGRGKKQMIPIPCRQHCYGVVGQKCNGIGCSCSACWNEEMEDEE